MSEASSSNDNNTFMATGNSEWDQWEHPFAPVDADIQPHFVDLGPRDATPVVLVHGWPDLWFAWRYQIGPLSEKYRVIVPDLRGYGRSSSPEDPQMYGTKNVAADIAMLLDFLNLPRAVLVGYDWGGAIVWHMCLYHPEHVLASVEAAKVLNTAPKRLFTATYRFPEEHEVDGVNVPYLEILQGIAGSRDPMYTERSELLSEEELDVYVRECSRSGFKGSCNYYAVRAIDFKTENPLPRVIPHRALYIGAGADKVLKLEMAAHMPHFVPNLETVLVKGGGHWLLWSHRNEVTEILLNWLGKVELSDGAPTEVTP